VSIRLYNTLTRKLDELPPPEAGPIGMYVCGPTVYQRAHVGNARPFVVFSWLRNWLRARGYDVTFVHNITDVNDSIYEAAPGHSAALAEQATQWYIDDVGDLGLGMPDEMPKATETIPEIIAMIERLIETGHAYAVDGDVYFRVASYSEYGQLSGQRPEEMAEQEPNPLKEDPRDFALWKANKPGEDTWWDSPWGRGRPGWHIECSAMAEKLLGPEFEIHGAGLDIVFPHNENELAQSRALSSPFARIWMHNGMLRFVGEKMSKSKGNVLTIREALDEWERETVLLFLLSGHWRKPIDLSEETLEQARAQADTFRNAFVGWEGKAGELPEEFGSALDDDLNTPEALALLHRWRDEGRLDVVLAGLELFGLGSLAVQADAPAEVRTLAEERQRARERKDFAASDRLRDEIAAAGWEVRDVAEGFQLVPR
jgi:cysteinyl-tRNA synthetase